MKTLTDRIKEASAIADPRQRMKALKAIQWRMRFGLLYAGLRGVQCALVEKEQAQVFDGRDNEAMKLRYYGACLGCDLQIELV